MGSPLWLAKRRRETVTPVQIPRLVKDVLNLISKGGEFTVSTINRKLETQSWDKAIVDQFTLELIMALLENEGEYDIKSTTVH